MKLYYQKGACSLVVHIILKELGINAELESVNLKTKITASGKNFYDINAKGSVPTLELDNGEVLTENAVILQYLADSLKAIELLPPTTDFKRYRILEWLNYITTELHKTFSILFNEAIPPSIKEQVVIPAIQAKMKRINQHLEVYPYIAGDHFTLPDAYLFVMLLWAKHLKVDLKECNHLERYFHKLTARASIKEALKAENR